MDEIVWPHVPELKTPPLKEIPVANETSAEIIEPGTKVEFLNSKQEWVPGIVEHFSQRSHEYYVWRINSHGEKGVTYIIDTSSIRRADW